MGFKEEELDKIHELLDVCKILYQKNFLAAADGNVSYRFSDERILITPSGRPKAFIKPTDIAVITLQGEVLYGKPSGERDMHLQIYRQRPEAKAVVHAHPPCSIAWSLRHPEWSELPGNALPEALLAVGDIPIVPYQRPGTEQMGQALVPYLEKEKRVMILSRHGAVAWGESLEEALMGMERVEHVALILKEAQFLGGAQPLPESEVKALKEIRQQMGAKVL